MLDLIMLAAIIVGIICIIYGKKTSNKVISYIGIILLAVGLIFILKSCITGFIDGFTDAAKQS